MCAVTVSLCALFILCGTWQHCTLCADAGGHCSCFWFKELMRVIGVFVSRERTCPNLIIFKLSKASLSGFFSYDFVEPMEGKRCC